MATKLDANQVLKASFDEASQSLKTIPASATTFEMELSHADGDSIVSHPSSVSASGLARSNANTGSVVAEFDISTIKSISIYTKTLTTIVGAQVLTLQISPVASGDFWVSTSITITPDLVANVTKVSSIATVNALRARVITAAAITSGTYDVIAVGLGV